MNKISGILPSSSRIARVDLREAPPVRPSAPDYTKSDFFGPALTWKARDLSKASMADEVTNDFFTKYDGKMETGVPRPELRPGVNFTPEEEVVPSFTPSQALPLNQSLEPYAEQIYGPDPNAQEEQGAPAKGQSLNVYA